jgi:tetratricopeptide (TPR) repeat protein
LKLLPDFAPAWLAIGQAACALEATPEAVHALRRAVGLNPSPEAQWWLADVLRQSGDEPGAVEVERNLRAHGPLADPRTTALYLATRGTDTAAAVSLAQEELHARGDVHTHDAIAWTLAANEENAAAATAMRTALQAGTCDPRLHLHAAIIAQAGGRAKEAQAQAARATAWQFALTPSERGRLLRFRSAPDVSLHSVIKNP